MTRIVPGLRVAGVAGACLLTLAIAPAFAASPKPPAPPKPAAPSKPAARAHGVPFERGIVSIGDTVETVHRIAGMPDRIVPWPMPSGPPYERHEYFFKDRTVVITVREGRVTGTADNRIVERP